MSMVSVTAAAAAVSPKVRALVRPTSEMQGRAALQSWKEQGIIDLSSSRYARLHTVPVSAVTLHDGFWTQRCSVNVVSSIPTMHDLLEGHGRMDNYRRLIGKSSAPQIGKYYSDSDVYKWTEAASFAEQSAGRNLFDAQIEAITALIQQVQELGGYLNTYYVEARKQLRMMPDTQRVGHELYNIGHLIQAAVARYRATGDQRLLDCCLRFVNDFLIPRFGPESAKSPIVAGHPEIEMALVELYRVTGDRHHLELAGYILEGDTRLNLTQDQIVYMFCGIPFTSRTKLEGHAVRAMYACCGATDYYLETGDDRYWKTLTTLWRDLVRDQMYVSGGVGALHKGEAFGEPYELPNAAAYGESCAAIGNFMWNWRMLHASADARHVDVMEQTLYNGINSGMSLSGTLYCYRNPLAFDPAISTPIRNPWYDTTCCPPNLERTFASLPGYFYSTSEDGLYLHLFHKSTLNWKLGSGIPIRVEQFTNYPHEGRVRIVVSPAREANFVFYVRVPEWSKGTKVRVAGKLIDNCISGRYLSISRTWKPGDVVEIEMDMTPRMLAADPKVNDDQCKVAIMRGPLLYCAEDLDQASGTTVRNIRLAEGPDVVSSFEVVKKPELLCGIDVIRHNAVCTKMSGRNTGGDLYHPVRMPHHQAIRLTLIPYYAWANRDPSAMEVWIPL